GGALAPPRGRRFFVCRGGDSVKLHGAQLRLDVVLNVVFPIDQRCPPISAGIDLALVPVLSDFADCLVRRLYKLPLRDLCESIFFPVGSVFVFVKGFLDTVTMCALSLLAVAFLPANINLVSPGNGFPDRHIPISPFWFYSWSKADI